VQVIIAPLPASGRFIGSSLIGDTSAPNPVDWAVAGAIAQAKASQ
jgi:hypothetical protein